MDESWRVNFPLEDSPDAPRLREVKPEHKRIHGKVNGAGWIRMDLIPALGKLAGIVAFVFLCGLAVAILR